MLGWAHIEVLLLHFLQHNQFYIVDVEFPVLVDIHSLESLLEHVFVELLTWVFLLHDLLCPCSHVVFAQFCFRVVTSSHSVEDQLCNVVDTLIVEF